MIESAHKIAKMEEKNMPTQKESAARGSKFKKMTEGRAFLGLSAEEQLEKMLEIKTFDQLLESGEVFNIEGARELLGYSAWGLRRLCRKAKISHIERFGQYFFLKSQVSAAFQFVSARA